MSLHCSRYYSSHYNLTCILFSKNIFRSFACEVNSSIIVKHLEPISSPLDAGVPELFTSLDQVAYDLGFVLMIIERVTSEAIDTLSFREKLDQEMVRHSRELGSVEV